MKVRRITSILLSLLCLCLVLTLVPSTARAAIWKEPAVARVKIGIVPEEFSSLESAIDAVKNYTAEKHATITLLADIDLADSLEITSGVFTIDLNGKKLSYTNDEDKGLLYITGGSNITISDSSTEKTGKISGTKYGVYAYGSTVTISGGTISGTQYGVYADKSEVTIKGDSTTIAGGQYSMYAVEESTVTMEGGKIFGGVIDVSRDGSPVTYGVYADKSEVTIKGGTIKGGRISNSIIEKLSNDYYGVYAKNNSTVKISGGTIEGINLDNITIADHASTISTHTYGVYADDSEVTISGVTVSGISICDTDSTTSGNPDKRINNHTYGVSAVSGSTVIMEGGTISGGVIDDDAFVGGNIERVDNYTYGVSATNSEVTISGGTISGTGEGSYGVYASDSEVTISGGKIEGDKGVQATFSSKITISGDKTTISGTTYGVYADFTNNDDMQCSPTSVTISGGTISGTGDTAYGVYAQDGSTVDIKGGTMDGSYGVCADSSSKVTIEGGTIKATNENIQGHVTYGVSAINRSTVTISGGTISDTSHGVYADNSTVTITGGTVSGEYGVYATESTLNISGGEISGGKNYSETGIEAYRSTLNISGGKISGAYGIYAVARCEITITGDATISGGSYGVKAEDYSKVNIQGGKISGDTGVDAKNSSPVTISGGKISGFYSGVYASDGSTVTISGENTTISGGAIEGKIGVYAARSTVIIDGGKISGYYGVDAMINSTVTISGGTISGEYGVAADSSNVTISGEATISGTSHGVYAKGYNSDKSTPSIVTIEGGTISGTGNNAKGVYAKGSEVTISGDKTTISGTSYGVKAETNSIVTIQGGEISGGTIEGETGVFAASSTVIIDGGKISGYYGVDAIASSKLTISGGEISNCYFAVQADNSTTVTISGGKISGETGVYATVSCDLTISGGRISGEAYGVHTKSSSKLTITGGEISGTTYGVYATDSEVTIQGGTIYGADTASSGVCAIDSPVTIQGGTIGGGHSCVNISNNDLVTIEGVTIEGGTISGVERGVSAGNSSVTITGGEISDTNYGVYAYGISKVTISGGEISGKIYGVFASESSTVTIQGGTISGTNADLNASPYGWDGTITLTLAEGASKGATFPGGITVEGTTLKTILAEDKAYWQGNKMIVPDSTATSITGGDVVIQAVCHHQGYAVSHKDQEDGTHLEFCTNCQNPTGEPAAHFCIKDTGKCICGIESAAATVTTGETTSYYLTPAEAIAAVKGCTAENEAVVKLMKDIDLGDSYLNSSSGVFTIDLNGKKLSNTNNEYKGLLYITGGSNITISDSSTEKTGKISGSNYGVKTESNSTVTIQGGEISGTTGVAAYTNSTVNIQGGTITGIGNYSIGVFAEECAMNITGGTISGTNYGVFVYINSIATISGDNTTISGTNHGVCAYYSTVTILGGEISSLDRGVKAETDSTVTIQGGEISGVYYGVFASDGSTVIISGDNTTISSTRHGVYANASTVNIQGSTISGTEHGVDARDRSIVTISGGTISGTTADLYDYNSTITLTLAEGATKGATFPGGITVEDTTLDAILDEASGIRYWGIENGKDVMLNGITGTALTDKGDITVRAVCDHTGSAHTEATDKGDGTHGYICTICQNPATEDHPYHPDHGKCICGAQAVARIGDAYYTDIEKAEAEWGFTGETLTLLTDVAIESELYASSTGLVFDLNGKTLTSAKGGLFVRANSSLTIQDSSATGTGKVVSTLFPISNNGTVTLESGTMTGYFIVNNGTMTINGGSVITSEQYAILNKGTLTINGGTISSSHDSAIMMYDNGTITVNGGTISGNSENNGTIKVLTATNSAEDMALTLNGGTVSGPVAVETNIDINTVTARLTLGNVKLNSTQADLALLASDGCKVEVRLTQVPEEPYTVNPWLNDGILLFGYSSDSVPADPAHYKSTIPGVLIGKNESGVVYAYICDHSGSQHTTGTTLVTGGHSFVCTVCQLNGFEDHHGGTATCTEPAKCAICRADYGEKDPDNHCGETFLHGEKKATCSAEGYTGDTVCYCGTLMAEGTVIPKLPHTYQDGECTGCGQPDPDAPDDDGEGEPGIPSEPTEPAPSDPTEPAPSDPTEPAPSDPTEPAPSDPTEPSEPEEPETPATSGIIRLAGKDRYLTGFAIADQLKSNWGIDKFQTVIVAYGKNFPDAQAGSYLAAVKKAPILLTESGRDTEVLQYIHENLVSGGKVYILGGTAAVSQDFEKGAADFGYSVERLKGANRFDTNLAILEAAGVNATDTILIATGKNYADSLSASATGLPMVLVDQELTQAQKDFLAKTSKSFVILGGTGAVSADVEAELDAIGDVTRVKGASRYETSVEIAKRFFAAPTAAVLAYAQSFPDGLCGGPLALSLGAPMILTGNDSFAAADAYISGITTGAVCGGSARISDDTVREIFDLSADTPIVKP